MDAIRDNSLCRPIPIAKIQANLAGFYSKTSQLVKEKFEDLMQFGVSDEQSSPSRAEPTDEQKSSTVRVPGLGRLVDFYA